MISTTTLLSSVTRPAQLLFLGSPWSLRLCNRATLSYDSYVWTKEDFSTRLVRDIKGGNSLDLLLSNIGFAYTSTLLGITEPFDLTLYSLYRVPDGGFESQERFSGSCIDIQESTSSRGSEISMRCVPEGSKFRYTPRVLWDHSEAIGRGSKVVIGGNTYVFE